MAPEVPAHEPPPAEQQASAPWQPWVLPFAVLMAMLAAQSYLPVPEMYRYALRTAVVAVVLLAVSRSVIALRPMRPLGSVLLGVAVFLIWIGPGTLIPGWRQHWLFSNSMLGTAAAGSGPAYRDNLLFLAFRVGGSALLVPIVEELFWRGWLMRWLAAQPFSSVPLGHWSARAFWFTAILFASEHGSYWEVGLLAGIAYGWWMVRTKSLADCILAHAVTNALLAAWVLGANQWQYWL